MKYIFTLFFAILAQLTTMALAQDIAPAAYHSLVNNFSEFYDETTGMPTKTRVASFKKRFDALFPGFYEPVDGQTEVQFDTMIVQAFSDFQLIRPKYEQVERDFPHYFSNGIEHFRQQFPEFTPPVPVWLVHSLGRMDGGTRSFGGKTSMIFGADVIARVHADGTIGSFLDHELFHLENGQWFKDCTPDTTIWCALWQEGTAVYAASVMNPGASDHMLMLDTPLPIVPKVDSRWREAICTAAKDLDKADEATYAAYFYINDHPQQFPSRWGYYVGYRIVQRIGQHHTLPQIDHFDNASAHRLMVKELAAMTSEAGGCDHG